MIVTITIVATQIDGLFQKTGIIVLVVFILEIASINQNIPLDGGKGAVHKGIVVAGNIGTGLNQQNSGRPESMAALFLFGRITITSIIAIAIFQQFRQDSGSGTWNGRLGGGARQENPIQKTEGETEPGRHAGTVHGSTIFRRLVRSTTTLLVLLFEKRNARPEPMS